MCSLPRLLAMRPLMKFESAAHLPSSCAAFSPLIQSTMWDVRKSPTTETPFRISLRRKTLAKTFLRHRPTKEERGVPPVIARRSSTSIRTAATTGLPMSSLEART